MMYYFVDNNGQQQGPVPANDLPRYGATPQTLVWKQGMANWQPAGTVAELSGMFAPPVAPPPPSYAPPQPIYAPPPNQQWGYQQPFPQPEDKNWMFEPFKKYFDFKGRARRKEFWMFYLFVLIVGIFLSVLEIVFELEEDLSFALINLVWSLGIFFPSLAVTVRRLHDIGKSGWWFLLWFIPIIGWIWAIVQLATDSQPGVNEYGSNPKGL